MPVAIRSLDASMGQGHRGDGEDRDAVAADQERVLVGPVDAAPVLDDPQPPGRDLVGDPVVEGDDAVRDVLLEPVLGDGPVAPLTRDNGRDAPVFHPEEEPSQLRPEDRFIAKPEKIASSVSMAIRLRADLIDHRHRAG